MFIIHSRIQMCDVQSSGLLGAMSLNRHIILISDTTHKIFRCLGLLFPSLPETLLILENLEELLSHFVGGQLEAGTDTCQYLLSS